MGFDKTFTDVDGDEIQVATDEGAAGSEYLGNVYVRTNGALGVSVTPKRARKIALAILAAADEAEGVTEDGLVIASRSIGGYVSPWTAEVSASSGVWIATGNGLPSRPNHLGPTVTPKDAVRFALATLRAARTAKATLAEEE